MKKPESEQAPEYSTASLRGQPTFRRPFSGALEPHFSFEFYPPKSTKGWAQLEEAARQLAGLEPDFISVTFGAGGSAKVRTHETSKRLRSLMNVDVVPHISCLGLTREQIEVHLEKYTKEGVKKLLALRGDVPEGLKSVNDVVIPKDGFRYANELVSYIKERGGFQVLVACYPEGHPEAPTIQTDVDNFMRKVDAGADAAITQYFYNNAAYFQFVNDVRRRGIDIPIVVGLMPVAPYNQVVHFSSKCDADIPLWIRKRMEGYQDDPASQLDLAVEIAVRQTEELFKNGAPGIHFYTLNRADVTLRVCEHLRPQPVDLGYSLKDATYGEEI
jgi:methylenetetrahydrofolate reductase (NADPH)